MIVEKAEIALQVLKGGGVGKSEEGVVAEEGDHEQSEQESVDEVGEHYGCASHTAHQVDLEGAESDEVEAEESEVEEKAVEVPRMRRAYL